MATAAHHLSNILNTSQQLSENLGRKIPINDVIILNPKQEASSSNRYRALWLTATVASFIAYGALSYFILSLSAGIPLLTIGATTGLLFGILSLAKVIDYTKSKADHYAYRADFASQVFKKQNSYTNEYLKEKLQKIGFQHPEKLKQSNVLLANYEVQEDLHKKMVQKITKCTEDWIKKTKGNSSELTKESCAHLLVVLDYNRYLALNKTIRAYILSKFVDSPEKVTIDDFAEINKTSDREFLKAKKTHTLYSVEGVNKTDVLQLAKEVFNDTSTG